jgi:hypothetical protein
MSKTWVRWQKWCVAVSTGGITLGIIQGFGLINWAYFFTDFLISWLTTIVTLLLGGQTNLTGTGVGGINLFGY